MIPGTFAIGEIIRLTEDLGAMRPLVFKDTRGTVISVAVREDRPCFTNYGVRFTGETVTRFVRAFMLEAV